MSVFTNILEYLTLFKYMNLHNPTPLGNGKYVGLANCPIIQVKFQCKPTFDPKFCVGL